MLRGGTFTGGPVGTVSRWAKRTVARGVPSSQNPAALRWSTSRSASTSCSDNSGRRSRQLALKPSASTTLSWYSVALRGSSVTLWPERRYTSRS
eukprot:3476200-Alexandrium_andersonii.AAC.1